MADFTQIYAKKVAKTVVLNQDRRDPVNNAGECSASAFDAPVANSCGVLNRGGIFYASLKMQGQDAPLEIALHGVRSESEAQLAFAALAQLRQAQCQPVELT